MFDLFERKEKKKGVSFDYVKALIFAYIFSFSRDGKSKWYGQQKTLANWARCSEKAVCNKLKELVDEGYLIKEEKDLYGMFHHNDYWVNPELIARYSEYRPMVGDTIGMVGDTIGMVGDTTNNNSIDNSRNNSIDSVYSEDDSNPATSLGNQSNIKIDKGGQRPPKNVFIVPTKEEVEEFVRNENLDSVDVNYFYKHYELSDWRDKGGHFINWKQTLLKWNKVDEDNKPKKRTKVIEKEI